MSRKVTELDFRMPEFRDAKVEDYEFRSDGKLVRKDRWERAVQSIRFIVGIESREFEIPEVVEAVRKLALDQEGWVVIATAERDEFPHEGTPVNIRLLDGSVLQNAFFLSGAWIWRDLDLTLDVAAWRDQKDDRDESGAAD